MRAGTWRKLETEVHLHDRQTRQVADGRTDCVCPAAVYLRVDGDVEYGAVAVAAAAHVVASPLEFLRREFSKQNVWLPRVNSKSI